MMVNYIHQRQSLPRRPREKKEKACKKTTFTLTATFSKAPTETNSKLYTRADGKQLSNLKLHIRKTLSFQNEGKIKILQA